MNSERLDALDYIGFEQYLVAFRFSGYPAKSLNFSNQRQRIDQIDCAWYVQSTSVQLGAVTEVGVEDSYEDVLSWRHRETGVRKEAGCVVRRVAIRASASHRVGVLLLCCD